MAYNIGTGKSRSDNPDVVPRGQAIRSEYELGANTPSPANLDMLADYLESVRLLMQKALRPGADDEVIGNAHATLAHMSSWVAFVRGVQTRLDVIGDTPGEAVPPERKGWPKGKSRRK